MLLKLFSEQFRWVKLYFKGNYKLGLFHLKTWRGTTFSKWYGWVKILEKVVGGQNENGEEVVGGSKFEKW